MLDKLSKFFEVIFMSYNELFNDIEILSAELSKSGKQDTATFFQKELSSLKSEEESEKAEALERLASCATIAQYGGFTPVQEKLLHRIIDTAIELKE